jgi:hypothetical protein
MNSPLRKYNREILKSGSLTLKQDDLIADCFRFSDGVNDSPMPNSRARRTSLGDADEPAERAQVGFGDDADGADVAAAGDGMNKMDNYGLDDDDAKSEGADADPFDKEAGGPQEDGNEADQFKDPSENADDDGLMMKKKGKVAMDD